MYFQKQQTQESFMLQVENVDKETQVTPQLYPSFLYKQSKMV